MRKNGYLVFAILLTTAQKVFCATQEASPELAEALKSNTHEPNFFSIIFALLVVVALIYITGLIYSKLNVVGANAVREQIKNHDLSRAVILSTTQLGQGKNLHVIELNGKKYLIGAAQNSISLLKELDTETKPQIKAEIKSEIEAEIETEEEFDVHKKYL